MLHQLNTKKIDSVSEISRKAQIQWKIMVHFCVAMYMLGIRKLPFKMAYTKLYMGFDIVFQAGLHRSTFPPKEFYFFFTMLVIRYSLGAIVFEKWRLSASQGAQVSFVSAIKIVFYRFGLIAWVTVDGLCDTEIKKERKKSDLTRGGINFARRRICLKCSGS